MGHLPGRRGVYGPRDRSLNKFVQFVRLLPVVPVIGNGQSRVQPVLVDDVARVVALAVDEPRATGQAFELGGPERLTMDEILRTVQRCSAAISRSSTLRSR